VAVKSVSMVFSYCWDIYIDWGLLRSKEKGKYGLRSKVTFKNYVYYYCMVTNAICRAMWMITAFVEEDETLFIFSWSWGTIIGLIKLYRRWQWSILRVENE
jgi:hypothetical protein